jgi:hypothetical protein
MTRDVTATNKNALAATNVIPVIFARLDFASGLVLFNTAPFPLTFNSETYIGAGNLGSISVARETNAIEATSITLALSGLTPSLVATALTENYHGRDARIYLGFLNDSNALVDTPLLLFRGRMDTMPVKIGKDNVISMQVESRLSDLFRPRIRRYNNQDQKSRYLDDDGFQYAEQMVDKELVWQQK